MGEVPARYLVARVKYYQHEFGVSAEEMLVGTSFEATDLEGRLALPGALVRFDDDLVVYRNAQRLAPVAGAGFLLGEALRPGDYGLLGHALISCSTVGEAFALINDIVQLDSPLVETHYAIEGAAVVIEARPVFDIEELLPFVTEELLAVWRYSELPVPGLADQLSLVEIAYDEPPHGEMYRQMFGVPVKFSAPRTAAYLPLTVLDQPIRFGDPQVAAILRDRIADLLRRLKPGMAAIKEVREALMSIPIRYWSAERLAQKLEWRIGALHSTLKSSGSSYKQLRLDVRYAMACQYLDDPSLSVAQISSLLDYSTPSNFIRFFKSISTMTPVEYRRSTASGADTGTRDQSI